MCLCPPFFIKNTHRDTPLFFGKLCLGTVCTWSILPTNIFRVHPGSPHTWPIAPMVWLLDVCSLVATAKFLCSYALSAGLLLRPLVCVSLCVCVCVCVCEWASQLVHSDRPFRLLTCSLSIKHVSFPFLPHALQLVQNVSPKNFVHTVQLHSPH